MTFFQKIMKFDDNEQIAKAVHEIVTQKIQVRAGTNEDPFCTADTNSNKKSFSRLVSVVEDDEPTDFTPYLYDIPCSHATLAVLPKERSGNNFPRYIGGQRCSSRKQLR